MKRPQRVNVEPRARHSRFSVMRLGHDLKYGSCVLRATRLGCAPKVAVGVENKGAGGIVPIGLARLARECDLLSEFMDHTICPPAAAGGREFEDHAASKCARTGFGAERSRAVQVAGGVEN